MAHGNGLWDVLGHAERAGSPDKDITRATEAPNDFAALLAGYPAVRAFAFAGQKAGAACPPPALLLPRNITIPTG